ncbi:hypothetical protein SS50377_22543 [Spironucleus salmonicida]|uniref:Uncharacterized protein n=1 Tax=Spironucleus salmonicida TaxID=348837 RepID=V6LE45_9EUKA|nr:hypothetical protein SS50377_22543 [Spironucleus salmonicida]|eukprot:EST41966.1 Hypothetical protein SS50377_18271 [Spironucleus salmonicida]
MCEFVNQPAPSSARTRRMLAAPGKHPCAMAECPRTASKWRQLGLGETAVRIASLPELAAVGIGSCTQASCCENCLWRRRPPIPRRQPRVQRIPQNPQRTELLERCGFSGNRWHQDDLQCSDGECQREPFGVRGGHSWADARRDSIIMYSENNAYQ